MEAEMEMGETTHTRRTKRANEPWDERLAKAITSAAGSMRCVWFHVVWFASWILVNTGSMGKGAVFDPFPFGLLTMVVSLEAIFLSTFILIAQNASDRESQLRTEGAALKTDQKLDEILSLLRHDARRI